MTQQNLLLVVDLFLSNFGHFLGISDAITIRAIVLSRYRHFHRFLIIEENRTQLTGGAEQEWRPAEYEINLSWLLLSNCTTYDSKVFQ